MATSMGTSTSKTPNRIPICDPCRKIDKIVKEAQHLCEMCDHQLCDNCLDCHHKTHLTQTRGTVKLLDVQKETQDSQVAGRQPEKASLAISEASPKDASIDVSEDVGNLVLLENEPRHVHQKATLRRGLNVSLEDDNVACEITTIALLRDKIIVSDEANYKLKVFNSAYEFLYEHKCDNMPYDVDQFDDTRVAATSKGGNLTMYSVRNDGLKELSNIKIKTNFYGVCCYDGKIYSIIRFKAGFKVNSKIYVYTPEGTLRRRFEFLSDGGTDFNNLQYITVNPNTGILYVTDWNNGIVALTTKGEVITSMSPTKLKNPEGIAVDDYGQIYVCGCNSNNVLQISEDGNETIEMLSSSARCLLAQCVKVCGSKLFLACHGSDVISIYELS